MKLNAEFKERKLVRLKTDEELEEFLSSSVEALELAKRNDAAHGELPIGYELLELLNKGINR